MPTAPATIPDQPLPSPQPCPTYAIATVSYLNALPLLHGLHHHNLQPAVPSALHNLLTTGRAHAALLPVVDLIAPGPRLTLLGNAAIAATHRSLTVRLYANSPVHRLTEVWLDPDSHTSVTLLSVLTRHLWGCNPVLRPLPADPQAWPELPACLLIGDKVIHHPQPGRPVSLDLATVWHQWQKLPFVFAAWFSRAELPPADRHHLARILNASRDLAAGRADQIAHEHAARFGWPVSLAASYFKRVLDYRLTSAHRRGLAAFLRLAKSVRNPHLQSKGGAA